MTPPSDRELLITRVFDAPRELVFALWTKREHVMRWWGPRDFTTHVFEGDFIPGSAWRACMRSAQGKDYWHHGVFREIMPPERLGFTFIWDEEPEHETLVTVTFAERGRKTEMTFRQGPFDSADSRDSHNEGWNECLDRLEAYVAQQEE